MLKNILVILHVVMAAGWFGLALSMGGIARKTAAGGAAGLIEEGAKTIKLMNVLIVLTFVFGLLVFFMGGGFAVYPPPFHAGMLLVLILIGIQFLMIRPAWAKVAGGGADAASGRKKMGMAIGIGHLIWLVVLILMFWRQYPLF